MRYKQPVITQDMMVRLWASYQTYVADCETVLRLLRAGSEIEHGPMAVNYEALRNVLPQPLVVGRGEDPASLRAKQLILLNTLLRGVDLKLLRRSGMRPTAALQKKANARLYAEVRMNLESDLMELIGSMIEGFSQRRDWSKAADLLRLETQGRWCIARLWLAGALYRLELPGAQGIAHSATYALMHLLGVESEPPEDLTAMHSR